MGRKAFVHEEIYVPQHPNGYSKKISAFDSFQNDRCKIRGFERNGCSPNDMIYSCDTERGSSGSPVLSQITHKVVAIHNCGDRGDCRGNSGSPIYEFWHEISNLLMVRQSVLRIFLIYSMIHFTAS